MNIGRVLILASLLPALISFGQEKKAEPVPLSSVPAVSKSVDDTYVLGAGDVIAVVVWKQPELSGSLLVRPDGMISISLLGEVQTAGLTPLQLADSLTAKLKKFIQDPQVSVVVTQIHSKFVYFLGEVGKKGPLEMTPNMTVLEAISSAGGLTDFANTKKIYILRNEDGKHLRIPVRYKDALKGDPALNLALKPGDTIVVP